MKSALILDLDNTIYPVSSIAENLFEQFFEMLDKDPDVDSSVIHQAKSEITRRPFQQVADDFNFSQSFKDKGIELLNIITYNGPMQPYTDYRYIKEITIDKFLVTTGFTKLQNSKITKLGIANDFKEIHIVDPEISPKTKKDIFQNLMDKYGYQPADILVIGDDPESEIKAAKALGIDTFLYDPHHKHLNASATYRSHSMARVLSII